jgi:hypothetical protein
LHWYGVVAGLLLAALAFALRRGGLLIALPLALAHACLATQLAVTARASSDPRPRVRSRAATSRPRPSTGASTGSRWRSSARPGGCDRARAAPRAPRRARNRSFQLGKGFKNSLADC